MTTIFVDAHGVELDIAEPGAPNLDAQSAAWLMRFWYVGKAGYRMARALFPDRPKGYVNATYNLGHYAANKATAMGLRERGEISRALVYEGIADGIYDRLPEYARW